MSQGHLPTLLAWVLSGTALDTVPIRLYLSGLDINFEAEKVGLTSQVWQAVFRLLASPSFVGLQHSTELINVALD